VFFYDLFKRGFYSMQIQEPFDSEGTGYATFYAFAFWSTIASGWIGVMYCCCYFCKKKKKKKKYGKSSFINNYTFRI